MTVWNAAAILLVVASGAEGLADGGALARLSIGDEVYRVPVGESFAVMVGGERVTMRIELEEARTFAEAGVEFRYPSAFAAEVNDDDPGVTIWTMQGRSAAVVLQRYGDRLDPESLATAIVASIVDRCGEGRVARKAVKFRARDRRLEGVRLVIAASSADASRLETEQNVFAFENTEGVFALIVQDARPAGGTPSAEFKELVRMLGESYSAGEEPPAESEEGSASDADADADADGRAGAKKA